MTLLKGLLKGHAGHGQNGADAPTAATQENVALLNAASEIEPGIEGGQLGVGPGVGAIAQTANVGAVNVASRLSGGMTAVQTQVLTDNKPLNMLLGTASHASAGAQADVAGAGTSGDSTPGATGYITAPLGSNQQPLGTATITRTAPGGGSAVNGLLQPVNGLQPGAQPTLLQSTAAASTSEVKPVLPAAAVPAANAATAAPPPKPAEVLKEAMSEIGAAGKGTATGIRAMIWSLKNKQPINITLDQVVQALFFIFLAFQLLLVKLFRPNPGWFVVFAPMGMLVGLALSYLYYSNKKRKAEACQVLGMNLGMKGLQHLLGTLPSWLSYTEREKMDWLNSVLEEVWPFYDAGVCKMVKQLTEGVFDSTLKSLKVPIKKISFKQLTFGDVPFRVESIYVNDARKDAMIMELDVRWCGEANITLAIELLGGELTKMCPKITDITFVGSLRIMLKPLVDTIPGFGAAVVTFRKPPLVKYYLDFGRALGGPWAANVIKPVINYIINGVIVNMLVWPQRIVVPIIQTEAMQVEIAKLQYRNQGVIKVVVVQAKELPKADLVGSSDPVAEITTDGKHVASTRCIKNTLTPQWNETFWLLVQEPNSQELKVTVSDKDMVSLKSLLTLDVNSAIGAKELLGRTLIKLNTITKQEPEPLTSFYHLGKGEFADAEGCGKGCGRIQLTCTYRSFENFKKQEVMTAQKGIVVVSIIQAKNLSRGTSTDKRLTACVRVKVGSETEEVPPQMSLGDHRWTNRNVLEFYDVPFTADIKVKVVEKRTVQDDALGSLDIPLSDVLEAADFNPLTGQQEFGFILRTYPLEDGEGGELTLSARYVPYY